MATAFPNIPQLDTEFQKLYLEAAGENLSPEELKAMLVALGQLRKEIATSARGLPEAQQKSFQPLLVRTQEQLNELSGRIALVTRPVLNDGGDMVRHFCHSSAFAITLGYLPSAVQASPDADIAGLQDMVDAFETGARLMARQRVSDANEEVRILESAIRDPEVYNTVSAEGKETIVQNLKLIKRIVDQETSPCGLVSAASYEKFNDMKRKIQKRSFIPLQKILAEIPQDELKQKVKNDLERRLYILRPSVEFATADLASAKQELRAVLQAIEALRHELVDYDNAVRNERKATAALALFADGTMGQEELRYTAWDAAFGPSSGHFAPVTNRSGPVSFLSDVMEFMSEHYKKGTEFDENFVKSYALIVRQLGEQHAQNLADLERLEAREQLLQRVCELLQEV